MKRLILCVVSLAAAGSIGCGSGPAEPNTSSSVSGALSVSTFNAPPRSIEAVDETGKVVTTKPDSTGAFALILAKGHAYRLLVRMGSDSEPVVFPRANGKLDSSFRVTGGAARVNVGLVRHFDAMPTGGFVTLSRSAGPSPAAAGADGECENGVDATTGAACVDDGEMSCEETDGEHADGEVGECVNGFIKGSGAPCQDDDATTEAADGADGADGECENGVEASSGAACVDDDADPTQPMAVAEHNVPDYVGGCDEGGDQEVED